MKKAKIPFVENDRVEVHWIDTANSATGDPKEAAAEPRSTMGFYKGTRMKKYMNEEMPGETKAKKVLVISDTKDVNLSAQEGWTAIPIHNVLGIDELIKGERRWVA